MKTIGNSHGTNVANADSAKLSTLSIFFLGVDGIIGSGIFLLPGTLFRGAGIYSLLLIFVAACAALLFGLCYAFMASRTKGSGGAWLYSYNSFGRFAGFEVGLFTWIQGVITIATETAAFLSALEMVCPSLKDKTYYNIAGMGTVLVLVGIGLLGEKVSKVADNVSTILKIGVLIVFVIAGAFFVKMSNFTYSGSYSSSTVNSAFVLAFYMYAGFSFLPVAAERMKDPQKNLPRVLVKVLIACSAIYILVMAVAIGTLGSDIVNVKVPLAVVFAQHFGTFGKMMMIIGMCGSILGVALAVSYSTPFIASSLATKHQLLPSFFGRTGKSGTPYVAVVLTGLLAMALILSGGYLFLVPCCVFISLIQYVSTACATIKNQKLRDGAGFDLKFGPLIPLLALAFCVYMVINMEHKVLIFGCIALVVSVALYFIVDRIERKNKA